MKDQRHKATPNAWLLPGAGAAARATAVSSCPGAIQRRIPLAGVSVGIDPVFIQDRVFGGDSAGLARGSRKSGRQVSALRYENI
ncbi:MAG: hypothetical protein M1309_05940 [Actinobacteria bacterium]|nr:hypothetical protein [Actinomycetota bacterium]